MKYAYELVVRDPVRLFPPLAHCAGREGGRRDLYRRRGAYTYLGGWNVRAVIATLLGCALAWSGPILNKLGMPIWFFGKLYSYAWFVGFGVAGLVYFILMRMIPPSSPRDSAEVA